MNSGQITSQSRASTKRSRDPFCVYIGKTTRCGGRRRGALRLEGDEESRKSGTPKPSSAQRSRSTTDAARYAASCGNSGASVRIAAATVAARTRASAWSAVSGTGAVLRLELLEGGGGVLQREPRRLLLDRTVVFGERVRSVVFDDLGFSDDGLHGGGEKGHANLRSLMAGIFPA
jgi:hypothetical protein